MDPEVIKEAIQRIRGLPTVSRIRKELTENFTLRVSKEELKKDLEEMVERGEVKEKTTTIKRSQFKGYKVAEEEGRSEEEGEGKSEEEEIIEEVFG